MRLLFQAVLSPRAVLAHSSPGIRPHGCPASHALLPLLRHRVSTALVLLATAPPAPISPFGMAVPVCLVISREITMSALREWAAASGGGAHKAVKVGWAGVWACDGQRQGAGLAERRSLAGLSGPFLFVTPQ